ncbi:MAG: hypothetical protein KC621_28680 [Myxococcales bacterium]|nr:hypothetical protein [Myxococcales bacterium]
MWWLACAPEAPTPAPPTEDEVALEAGPIVVVTSPPEGHHHHHATVDWGEQGALVAMVVGDEPATQVYALPLDDELAPDSPIAIARGDRPDVAWAEGRWVVAHDDAEGGIWLWPIAVDGGVGNGRELRQSPMLVEAVDLAVWSGGGAAIWTEAGGPGMAPDDGRIVARSFDTALEPVGDALVLEDSRRTTSDAASRDGGWVGAWALHVPHPTIPGEVAYEAWAALMGEDGEELRFRVDDLQDRWPSRPAVAVTASGRLAVTFRDKTGSEGESAGAWVRWFEPDGEPLGPSLDLDAGTGGNRVDVAAAGERVLCAWQQTENDGTIGVRVALVDPDGSVVAGPLALNEPGGDDDQRPSLSVRATAAGWEAVVVWETAHGIRGRRVAW